MASSTLLVRARGMAEWGAPFRAIPSSYRTSRRAEARREAQARRDAVRVAVVAENPLIREKLASLVDQLPDLEVVARAACDVEAMAHVAGTPPDVVVLYADPMHQIPKCVRRAGTVFPGVRVVVMDPPTGRDELLGCIKEGAAGFVTAGATVDELADTIQKVAGGQSVLPEALAPLLFAQLVALGLGVAPGGERDLLEALTARERAVAELIVEGKCNKEIAGQLGVSVHTVKTHLHHLLDKLSVDSRLQLAAKVRRAHTGDRPW